MKEKNMYAGACSRIVRYAVAVAVLFAILFLGGSKVAPVTEVQAAVTLNVKKINFTDGSGSYLQKKDKSYYLYNAKKKPLTGIQYLKIADHGQMLSGFYYFNNKGKLMDNAAVYQFSKQKVHGVTFDGYYYTNTYGRFLTRPSGWRQISRTRCGDLYFNGYFYLDAYGRLSNPAQMRYMPAKKIGSMNFKAGYYYFNKYGGLRPKPAFYKLNQTLNGKTYKGYYYFGYDKTGIRCNKAGWVTLNGQQYYVSDEGRRYENCWVDGYYLLANGTIAKNMQVPDGSFVDSNGRKIITQLDFTDGSGSFLKKSGTSYYLFDASNKPLSGIQYLKIPTYDNLMTGFYYFNDKGRLMNSAAVYKFTKQVVHGVTFDGYYYTNAYGRFLTRPSGWRRIAGIQCGSLYFNGYFYLDAYGRLSNPAQMRYMPAKKIGSMNFKAGYYYFNKYGGLRPKPAFYKLNQTLNGKTYKGYYYFGYDKTGIRCSKAGWITLNGQKYYVSNEGKRYENCWVGGYYLQADGTIARSKQVPDGSYVDAEGHKIAKEEMALSGLKKQVENTAKRYGGTWSVYVKNLKTGDVLNLNERSMYSASVIKPFVMASVFDQISKKKLSYNSTIKGLLNEMITVSDNEAFNSLVRYNSPSRSFTAGAGVVNAYLKKNGYTKTGCHHTLHPAYSSYASDGQGSNVTSAKDCGVLLERIYRGKCVNATYSKEMLNFLKRQTRRWKIPQGVPSGITVANKTGETSSYQHDMAIVYGKKTTYVICIMANVGEYNGCNGIRAISSQVYNYLNK